MDPLPNDVAARREIIIELLASAAIRYLTRPPGQDSEPNSPTDPDVGLSSSPNDRSL